MAKAILFFVFPDSISTIAVFIMMLTGYLFFNH